MQREILRSRTGILFRESGIEAGIGPVIGYGKRLRMKRIEPQKTQIDPKFFPAWVDSTFRPAKVLGSPLVALRHGKEWFL